MGLFALAGVCEPVGLSRGEGEGAVGQIKFAHTNTCLWACKPPSSAAEGLGRCFERDPIIQLTLFAIPSRCCVAQSDAALILSRWAS